MQLWGFAGESLIIPWTAPFQTTGLFPRARVLNSSGSVAETVNLSANGTIAYHYTGSWTPPSEGQFTAVVDVYTDSARTVLSDNISGADIHIRIKDISGSRGAKHALGAAKLSRKDMEMLVEEVAKRVWEYQLKSGRSANLTLSAKSEFDPASQVVKTDLTPLQASQREHERAITTEMRLRLQDLKDGIQEGVLSLKGHVASMHGTMEEKMKELNLDGAKGDIETKVVAMGDMVMEKMEGMIPMFDKIEQSMASMHTTHMKETMRQYETYMADLSSQIQTLLASLTTQEQMLEAFNKEEQKRFKELLGQFQTILKLFVKRMEKVNLTSVFGGFDVLNRKINELAGE